MNVPQTEIAKQRAEAERLAALGALLNSKGPAVKRAVMEKAEGLLEVIYPLVAANALASGDGTARLTLDFTLRFAPEGHSIEAVAKAVSQPREFTARGGDITPP